MGKPMLCSGSTMGSREGILDYLDAMINEFEIWNQNNNCRSDMAGDDQSIHNYIYYTGGFNKNTTVSIPHRTGPIHVVGFQADKIFRAAIKKYAETHGVDLMKAESRINNGRFHGSNDVNWRDWLGPEHALTDSETGFILNLDRKPSPQVHQFDRFGFAFESPWLSRMKYEVWNS